MTDFNTMLFAMAPLVLGAGLYAAGADDIVTGPASGPVRCEIVASNAGGMTRLDGVAHAADAATGTYRLRVTGSGANINQGGDFEVRAGEAVTLGSVTIGGGGRYEASLEVTANGVNAACAKAIGGSI